MVFDKKLQQLEKSQKEGVMDGYGFSADIVDLEPGMQKIFDKTDIPFEEIKEALGLFPSLGQVSIKRIRAIFRSHGSSDAKKSAALNKWNEWSLVKVAQATTTKEIRAAYKSAPPVNDSDCFYSEAQSAALKKWIQLASNVKEIEEIYGYTYDDTDELDLAIIKRHELFLALIGQARNIKEARLVYDLVLEDSEISYLAFQKMVELASTIKELDFIAYHIQSNDELKLVIIRQRQIELFLPLIEKANTLRKLKSLLNQAPNSDILQIVILEKMIHLAKTVKDLLRIYPIISESYLVSEGPIKALKKKCILKLIDLSRFSNNAQQSQAQDWR